ncbi:MAG: RNA-binding protein [Bacteroidota bacterium]|nr:RNA-binding protein [Bacteroidota bacterium]
MNIFVAKLNSRTTSDSLQGLFEQFGEVSSAKVIIDKETGHSKRFGFVEMPDDEQANAAINQLNETLFEGSNIVVKKARPKEEGQNSGPSQRGGFQRRPSNNRFQSPRRDYNE